MVTTEQKPTVDTQKRGKQGIALCAIIYSQKKLVKGKRNKGITKYLENNE